MLLLIFKIVTLFLSLFLWYGIALSWYRAYMEFKSESRVTIRVLVPALACVFTSLFVGSFL